MSGSEMTSQNRLLDVEVSGIVENVGVLRILIEGFEWNYKSDSTVTIDTSVNLKHATAVGALVCTRFCTATVMTKRVMLIPVPHDEQHCRSVRHIYWNKSTF